MDEVADLVVSPFRDIVEKGNAAVANANGNSAMHKAAQALVKEGERALKRIEPLCQKLLDEYGANFHNALKDENEIANYRTQLTDLLWEFDDYIEDDTFEAEKFAELQAVSRKAAPRINDILMRMKLEVPADKQKDFPSSTSQISPPITPLPGHVHPFLAGSLPLGGSTGARSSTSSGQLSNPRPEHMTAVEFAAAQLSNNRDRQSSYDGLVDADHQLHPLAMKPPPDMPPPPPPPNSNPWERRVTSIPEEDNLDFGKINIQRRPAVQAMSPVPPPARLGSSSGQNLSPLGIHSGSGFPFPRSEAGSPIDTRDANYEVVGRNINRQRQSSMPQEEYLQRITSSPTSQPRSPGGWAAGVENIGHQRRQNTNNTYLSDVRLPSSLPPPYPEDTSEEANIYPSNNQSNHQYGRRRLSEESLLVDPTLRTRSSNPPPPITPNIPVDMGLILVEQEPSQPRHVARPSSSKACVIAVSSSYVLSKGFCHGAREVVRGEIGVKRARKPVGFTGAATVARCSSCLFELNFEDIENDVNRLDKGNLKLHGVAYRLRFLQKSHIATKRSDDSLFACPFCVEQGYTVEEGDATVFFNVSSFFKHLARHPRPLPEVSGISVVDQAEVPGHLKNDYDIHFLSPPVPHPAIENADHSQSLPTGVAKDHIRRIIGGVRLLPDRTPALEMLSGGKIAKLTWPSKYNGEWCLGWHDGVYASIPFDMIRLELPPANQIRLGEVSNIRANAKWTFSYKDKDSRVNWLRFKKNEIITNLSWSYAEYWCWSGTNAKGENGIFPQAFIDSNTVQELSEVGASRASNLSNERNKSSSILPRFSIRKTQGPPSITGSMSSQETTAKTNISSLYFGSKNRRNSGEA